MDLDQLLPIPIPIPKENTTVSKNFSKILSKIIPVLSLLSVRLFISSG